MPEEILKQLQSRIAAFSTDQLKRVNRIVLNEYDVRRKESALKQAVNFKSGDRVYFEDSHGRKHTGVVKRVNIMSLTVKDADDGKMWRVAYDFIKRA